MASLVINPINGKSLSSSFISGMSGNLEKSSFYSSYSVNGYLTPLQRKKLREIRNIELTNNISPPRDSKKPGKKPTKKFDGKVAKAKKVIGKSKELVPKKKTLERAMELIVDNNRMPTIADTKNRKFFATRSPDHLNKCGFSMSLLGKRNVSLSYKSNLEKQGVSRRNNVEQKTSVGEKKAPVLLSRDVFRDNNAIPSLDDSVDSSKSTISSPGVPNKEQMSRISRNVARELFPLLEKKNLDDSKVPSSLQSSQPDSTVSEVPETDDDDLKSNDKENCMFDFDLPADDVFRRREVKIRELQREKLDEAIEEMKDDDDIVAGHIMSDSGESFLFGSSKLYPIFYPENNTNKESPKEKANGKLSSSSAKKSKKFPHVHDREQYIIDAGQKNIGASVCSTCNMVYSVGEVQDEDLHTKYHNLYLTNLKFSGWKTEHVIGESYNGRIIMVKKEDRNFKLKKIEEVLTIVNRDLGFPSVGVPSRPNATFLLFISNDRRVVGCLVAESISSACKVVLDTSAGSTVPCLPNSDTSQSGSWCSSSEKVRAVCGINRIWVAADSRRLKIATKMVDCLRCHFIYGYVIKMDELAFSDPSLDGREFAASYTGTDNFLVYK